MHVLIGLLLAALLVYLAYRFLASGRAPSGPAPLASSDRSFAFLSNGVLFCRERGAAVKQLESAYVQEAMDRRDRARERHSWKEGTSFGIASSGAMRNFGAVDKPILATAAAFEHDGSLLYCLKDDKVGGLFRRDAGSGAEQRLLLRQNLHLGDLALCAQAGKLAATSHQSAGVANIALLAGDGSNYREVTGGDTVDSAPAWIPGVPDQLLFQSCGLARNEQGYIVAQGHATVQKLDMASGKVAAIVEDPRFDFLRPRVCPAGNLHFIRRPFEAPRYGASNILLDTLLFPFRLLRAVFHYLNFFSLMYSRKPLTSASGPAVKADMKDILLQGRRIDAEKALRSARAVQGVPSLVPDNWELVCRDPQGRERVLATNVASYDIGPDGTVLYSNGQGVFALDREGSPRLAMSDQLVAEVVAGLWK
ncbi:MAG TPA: hypothetical protein VLJ58_01690 [Ramlibacter sp.]|nr:hypothetical protein [Ramlibacter sp.]